jgi:hypothetical protein
MAKASQVIQTLGLFDPATVAEVARLEGMQAQGGRVDLGEPLPADDLLALAEVTPDDVARAAADWQAGAPAWAKPLLDARAVDAL